MYLIVGRYIIIIFLLDYDINQYMYLYTYNMVRYEYIFLTLHTGID